MLNNEALQWNIVGGSPCQAWSALSSQDVHLRAYTGWLLSNFGLADVETYCLWKVTASGRTGMALLWDLWPSHWPHSRGEAGVGRVSFTVFFQKWAGPTKEQGKCVKCFSYPKNLILFFSNKIWMLLSHIDRLLFVASFQLSVDTLQFLLFLYIQQLNRLSLRASLIGEEWPSLRTRLSDRETKSSSQNKVLTLWRS